ncbi:hypothetical protein GF327_04945, partial [Candidatus Woesearchaeota archaeon]|nr:hypothetical protein [Candidatus Woesearchaeota archaeon]
MATQDNFYSKTSFYLSLGFWVPLFNIGFAIVSLWFGLKALRLAEKNPKKYQKRKYAVIGIALSLTTLVLSIFGIFLFGF